MDTREDESLARRVEPPVDEMAAAIARLEVLRTDLQSLRSRYAVVVQERDRERADNRRLRSSAAYRIGQAIRHPVATTTGLVRTVTTRLLTLWRTLVAEIDPAADAGAPAAQPPRRPARVYIAVGLDLETLRSVVRALARCALVTADHVPVVVTDSPSFSLLANLGVVLEYVPDRQTWRWHRGDLAWDVFLSKRLAAVFQTHHPASVTVIDPMRPVRLCDLLPDPERRPSTDDRAARPAATPAPGLADQPAAASTADSTAARSSSSGQDPSR